MGAGVMKSDMRKFSARKTDIKDNQGDNLENN